MDDHGVPRFDPVAASPLTFEPLRLDAFPTFRLGIEAARAGGAAPAVFNAANEEAVALFLDDQIPFGDIPARVNDALTSLGDRPAGDRESLLSADREARIVVRRMAARA